MTELAITPNYEKKRLELAGTVAAGEHVAVTIVGGGAWIGTGKALRLRVICGARTVAKFPLWTEDNAEDWPEDVTSADAWDSANEGADATCVLNLNTVPAAKLLRFGGMCLWVLDDAENHTLYGSGEYIVEPWPKERGEDEPYYLDEYPDIVAELGERIDAVEKSISDAVDEANGIVAYVTAARNDAQSAAQIAGTARNGAQTAQGKAEDAQTAAEAAQVAAEAALPLDTTLATEGKAADAKATGDALASKADASATSAALLALDATKADKADLDGFVNAASYDSNAKKILLKHDTTTVAEIDATAFIKDGMVSSVAISNGKLVITFNTDAGLEPIEIPLTDIFNPANYYDKAAADAAFVAQVEGKGLSTEDFTAEEKQKLAGIAEGADVTPPPIAPSENPDDTGKAADAYETGWRLAAKAEARSGTQGNIAVYAEYSTLLEDSGFKPSDFATHDDVALVASNVDTAQATAYYAQSSADDAFTKADEALSTANNAWSAATEAKSTADTAKSTADGAKELAQTAKSEVATKIYYTTAAQPVASDTIALSERTFNVLDATAYGDTNTVMVTLPSEPTAESGKVADVLLRVDTGATVPTLDFDETANTFIAADDSWATLEASSHNVFSFTSAGVTGTGSAAKRVWVVGRVTAALETGGV